MALAIEKLIFCDNDKSETSVHSLPCKIHFDGTASVDDFFIAEPSCETKGTDELKVSFRGFPLIGMNVKLPETYQGFILENENQNMSGKICNKNKFNSITYWNWDKMPSKNDVFLSTLDWLDLSQKVHDPIEDIDPV